MTVREPRVAPTEPWEGARSLIEVVRRQAERSPERTVFTYLASSGAEEDRLSFGELDLRARAVAARLQRLGLAGERALLIYPPGLAFVVGFLGCLYADVVAVPAYPPRSRQTLPRLRSILRDARPRAALTTSASLDKLRAGVGRLDVADLVWLATDQAAGDPETWDPPRPDSDRIAFLQYTSGSTGDPKGVVVSHGNLLHNEESIRRAFRQDADSVVVGWLPLFHDMGLIGNVLQPLYVGASCHLMSPLTFLARPARWLQAVSRYSATTSGGPCFGYEHCVRRVTPDELEGLDLSSWRVAFNGAEPVRARVLADFEERFGPLGFRPEAAFPCYGLAEATLFVTGSDAERRPAVRSFDAETLRREGRAAAACDDREARDLVGCGGAAIGTEVVIVDGERGTELPAGRVGEVWVAGPGVARGYWGRDAGDRRTFGARLAERPGAGPFLRTGDLGFLDCGELFVTGRAKDLIIVRGRNHHPHDLEASVEGVHPALRPGGGAAFAVEDGDTEGVVVAWELERTFEGALPPVFDAVRRAVLEGHGIGVREVVLIRAGTIPKTSSGKIRRQASADAYRAGRLEVVARSGIQGAAAGAPASLWVPEAAPRDVLAAETPARRRHLLGDWLRAEVARAAEVAPEAVEPTRSLPAIGLDSLAAASLQRSLAEHLGVEISYGRLLSGGTLDDLVAEVLAAIDAGADRDGPAADAARRSPPGVSHGQEALWLLHRVAPESSAYNLSICARVHGAVDATALGRALDEVAKRHAVLRSVFVEEDGAPVRHVLDRLESPLAEVDATSWTPDEVEQAAARFAHRPFDLARGPLVRVALWRRGPGEAVLVLAVHHAVADLSSVAVVLRDLEAFYLWRAAGPRHELPPVTQDFDDFVRWQRSLLDGARGEELWAYWQRRLAPPLPELDLPTDRPRPPARRFRGAATRASFEPERSEAVEALARSAGATRFSVLLAVFQVLLSRYTGQEEAVIGTVSTGRPRPELAEVVGYCVNPVVLRSAVPEDESFLDLIARTRETVASALAHAELPFPLLAARLRPQRDPSRSPLFQAMFLLQDLPGAANRDLVPFALGEPGTHIRFADLTLESLAIEERASQFDLGLRMATVGGRLVASLQFDTDLFDPATARRLLDHYGRLLEGALAAPDAPLAGLGLLSAAERAQLREWNAAPAVGAADRTLHALVAEQAGRTPDAPALRVFTAAGDEVAAVTYGALVERAARLAHRLVALGVGPEVPVGVCLERSDDLVVALLAVLDAGGAYVPLDPGYPPARLGWMLEDSGAPVVIGRLPSEVGGSAVARITVIEDPSGTAAPRSRRRRREASPSNLAYLIYTSGSTGTPKGVAIEHRSAARFVDWAARAFSGAETESVLAATSVSFDLSVFELFATLCRGGCAVLVPDVSALPAVGDRARVTLVNTVPSAMDALADGSLPASLRTVNLAGEPLHSALAARLHELPAVRRVVNLYGPSEDTTYSTWSEVPPGTARVTIGGPVEGTEAWLVDRRFRPVAIGVAGELVLGGDGLARGYLRRPGLTAERFVPDPFGREGARLYRTGDLARRLPDGDLEFLGRIDHQVKLRGFRVELGEVEAALRDDPGVSAAAVVVRGGPAADPELVAFVAASDVTAAHLRRSLERRLPRFMVPARIVVVGELPSTPSGKVDRRRLAQEPRGPQEDPDAAAGGRTPTEEIVAGLVADLVGRDRVGVDDDFFHLGGHSLAAMRLVARLREAFGVELPATAVFATPTARALAVRLDAALAGEEGERPLPPVPTTPATEPAPASFQQRNLWFLSELNPGEAAYNLAVAIDLEGAVGAGRFAAALRAVTERHETLRTRFEATGGDVVQRVVPAGRVGLAVVDLSVLPPSLRARELELQGRIEAALPFDLRRPPLLRAVLLRSTAERSRLLLTAHHVAVDGWSLGLLAGELATLYGARDRGSAGLPPLPVRYADYARWQRERFGRAETERLVAFWQERLRGAPPVLRLPSDRPWIPGLSRRGASCAGFLPPELADRIEASARRTGTTPFMIVLAAFGLLLARLTGEDDLVIGAPVANRPLAETESLVGMFVDTLPLRLDLSAGGTARDLLSRVQTATLDAFAHKDLPFDELVRALGVGRESGGNPLFQVMLAWQEIPVLSEPRAGLRWTFSSRPAGSAKFDLSLRVSPRAAGAELEVEYRSALFDAVSIERWLGCLRRLIAGVVERTDEPLARIPMLGRGERHQMLVEWGSGPPPRPAPRSLQRSFEEAAARTPDAVAIVAGSRFVTYGGLAAAAGLLARRLRQAGVRPGERVAVFAPRSPELVAGLLAVLATGAAFVVVDPSDPPERTRVVLDDAKPRLLLAPAGAAQEAGDLPRLSLDTGGTEPVPTRAGASASESALRVAYVMYTSGSTGRPKGVEVEHRSIAGYLDWVDGSLLGPRVRRLPWITRMSFDAAMKQVFWPLSRGLTVFAVDEEAVSDPRRLLAELERSGWDGLNCVPSLWNAVLVAMEASPEAAARTLRHLFLGGEALTPDLVARTRRLLPDVEIVNLYGPTEATANACWWVVASGEAPALGAPLPGRWVRVLGRDGGPTALGASGELCLGGGLARGYLGRPAQTADRFVPDPWGPEPGARLYRTGDRVRRLATGALLFEGRIDRQVKLRGFRVELEEIEAVLCAHATVGEAAVAVHEEGPGRDRLVAYVEPRHGETADPGALRAWAEARLPRYMVPAQLVPVDALPRTPGGKVDRGGLAKCLPAARPPDPAPAATPLERILAAMMAELLGREQVEVGDNFFELGGHSLLAAELVHRIQETFQIDLPILHVLFDTPTAGALAAFLTDDPELRERVEAVVPERVAEAGAPGKGAEGGGAP